MEKETGEQEQAHLARIWAAYNALEAAMQQMQTSLEIIKAETAQAESAPAQDVHAWASNMESNVVGRFYYQKYLLEALLKYGSWLKAPI